MAHNADFDVSFIRQNCDLLGLECEQTVLDTVALARVLLPTLNRFKLNTVAKALNISLENHHRAVDDAGLYSRDLCKICGNAAGTRHRNYGKIWNRWKAIRRRVSESCQRYHAIMLAQNDIGRVNLYRLVSDSHIKYYAPTAENSKKSNLMKYREGILHWFCL